MVDVDVCILYLNIFLALPYVADVMNEIKQFISFEFVYGYGRVYVSQQEQGIIVCEISVEKRTHTHTHSYPHKIIKNTFGYVNYDIIIISLTKRFQSICAQL